MPPPALLLDELLLMELLLELLLELRPTELALAELLVEELVAPAAPVDTGESALLPQPVRMTASDVQKRAPAARRVQPLSRPW